MQICFHDFASAGLVSREQDSLPVDLGCLPSAGMPATLISTQGSHCEVWQSMGSIWLEDERHEMNFVIKRHLLPCPAREVDIYYRDYRKLRGALGEIVPTALFARTRMEGEENLVVLAETVVPWFNIANPAMEAEAVPLLARLSKAKVQLRHFIDTVVEWWQQEGKVIDLYGVDNLVLDKNQQIRYVDSFNTFFHEDLLYILDEPDESLRQQIQISLKRLQYLRHVLVEADKISGDVT